MEAVKGWALAVCVAAVAGSLARLVSPGGSTQKVYQITVSMFFLCCMLSPVLTGAISGDFDAALSQPEAEYHTEALEDVVDEQVKESFSASLRELVCTELAQMDVKAEEIFVNVNTDGEGGIFITEMAVHLDAAYQDRQSEIEARLTEKTGQRPVIQYRQEEK